MRNLNLLFHKTSYKTVGTPAFNDQTKENNAEIFSSLFVNRNDYRKNELATQRIYLKTTYPGLLVGSGYAHSASPTDAELKLGFSFDYVSGQPYVPGSSVKGVLRSQFREHPELICALTDWDRETVKMIEQDIFENNDIFFDAVLFAGNERGEILGSDYITPHKRATKDPTPIRFLKVLPDVTFEFSFRLSDSVLENGMTVTASKKRWLFSQLLELVGVGAKTNVGYGHLVPCPKQADSGNGGSQSRGGQR